MDLSNCTIPGLFILELLTPSHQKGTSTSTEKEGKKKFIIHLTLLNFQITIFSR